MFGAGNSQFTLIRTTVAVAVLAAVSACGGGGGGASGAPTTPTDVGQSSGNTSDTGSTGQTGGTTTPTFVALDAFASGPNAFDAKVDASYSTDAALNALAGGTLYAAWNPTDPNAVLQPGMKVLFFGRAAGCSTALATGPVAHGSDADYATAASRATLPAADAQTRRWVPSFAAGSCDTSIAGTDGPSMVQIDARDSGGAIGLYTNGGATASGTAFLAPYDASGQGGSGANAGIIGSFVGFRQAWGSASAIHPWRDAASGAVATARVASVQTIGATAAGDAAKPSEVVQVKQQIAVTFLNVKCAQSIISATTPCQIQYMLNTDVQRTGVTDWSTVDWFNAGGMMFDPGQGGIPVVQGPIRAKGEITTDATSGLALFQSAGNPTQHTAFADVGFDVRIGFQQLLNAARIAAGRKQSVAPSAISDSAMASLWGTSWNDPAAWVLLSSEVGQEVYNPYIGKQAYIGGSFSRLYVGAQL